MNTIIANSAPRKADAFSTFVPPSPERKAEMRAHANQVIADRVNAGLHPDGRIMDMVKYAAHLRAGTK